MGQKGALTGQGWHLWGRRYTYGAGGALMGQKGALMGLGWHLWGRRGHLWGRVGTYGAEVATYGAVTHIYFLPPPPYLGANGDVGQPAVQYPDNLTYGGG